MGRENRELTRKTRKKSMLRDILEVIVPAFLIFLVVRTFFFETRWVPSPSMVPTLEMRDRFIENKLIYRFREPRRGEIIVFEPPEAAVPPGYRRDDFVKRIVGLPGETINIRSGKIYISNGRDGEEVLLPEPYVEPHRMDHLSFGPFVLGEDEYFVLGDNRRESRDSRYWGAVPRKSISGKAFWRFWPLRRMSILR